MCVLGMGADWTTRVRDDSGTDVDERPTRTIRRGRVLGYSGAMYTLGRSTALHTIGHVRLTAMIESSWPRTDPSASM